MAGTYTRTGAFHGDKYVETIVWTDTAGAGATAVTGPAAGYYLYQVETIPGTVTSAYTLTITNSSGTDVLQGAGAARSTSAKQICAPAEGAVVSTGQWTVTVGSETSTNDTGTIIITYVGGNKA